MGNKIFINLGANIGLEALQFDKINPGWKHYLIEPFEPCFSELESNVKRLKVVPTIIKKIAHTYDGDISFYTGKKMSNNKPSESSSIFKDKTSNMTGDSTTLPCFDFSKWLNQFSDKDFIYLHMDVEGAEYTLLPKLFEDGTINNIKVIGCEFHLKKIPSISPEFHYDLVDKLTKKFNNRFIIVTGSNTNLRKISFNK